MHRLARLGVNLVNSTTGGVMVYNGSESSFLMDVNFIKDLDPIFFELKKSIHEKFPKGRDNVLRYKGYLCVFDIDGFLE